MEAVLDHDGLTGSTMCHFTEPRASPDVPNFREQCGPLNRHSAFEKVIIEGATSTHVALLLYSRMAGGSSWVSLSSSGHRAWLCAGFRAPPFPGRARARRRWQDR